MAFLYKKPDEKPDEKKNSSENKPENASGTVPVSQPVPPPVRDASPAALRELLEKNLKWSQIIYEQNRKIKSALVWKAVVSWLWFVFVVGATVAGSYQFYVNREAYIQQFTDLASKIAMQAAEKFTTQAVDIFPGAGNTNVNANQAEDFLNLLPLDPAQKELLKAMMEKQQH